MNERVQHYINEYYIRKNYSLFKEKCGKTPFWLDELTGLIKSLCREYTLMMYESEPALEIYMRFDSCKKGEFSVEYATTLNISKVADIFFVYHMFSVKNLDPNRMTPVLDGFDAEPFTFAQADTERKIVDFLKGHNIERIQLSETNEVIGGKMLNEKSIFGTQATVENVLFRNIIFDN